MSAQEPGERARLVERKIREHAALVNEAIGVHLPREGAKGAGPLAASLREYLGYAKRRIRPSFAVYEPMRHVVAAGGKRIRPTLCLLACEAAGGRAEDALPTAVGIEFLHTFTLVHDDIMDGALTRRGAPTLGAVWGNDLAITIGDALFALAFRAILNTTDATDVPAERVVRVMKGASDTSVALAQGQAMDLLFAHRRDVTVDEYMEMIRLKTGVLLEFSLEAGAVLGGADDAAVRAMSAFGAPLGIAFQLRDDVLDLVGDPAALGKPVGGDVRTGKRTLLVSHGFEHSPRAGRLGELLDKAPDDTTDDDVQEAIAILRDAGSIEYARKVAEEHVREAHEALRSLPHTPGSEALEALGALAQTIATRNA